MGEKKTALDLAESIRGMPCATIAQDQVRQILRAIPADIMDIVGEMADVLETLLAQSGCYPNCFCGRCFPVKGALKRAREAGIGEKDE